MANFRWLNRERFIFSVASEIHRDFIKTSKLVGTEKTDVDIEGIMQNRLAIYAQYPELISTRQWNLVYAKILESAYSLIREGNFRNWIERKLKAS